MALRRSVLTMGANPPRRRALTRDRNPCPPSFFASRRRAVGWCVLLILLGGALAGLARADDPARPAGTTVEGTGEALPAQGAQKRGAPRAFPLAIERIRIEGNWRTQDTFIRRLLAVQPGDVVLSRAPLDRSVRALQRTGLFTTIELAHEPGSAEPWSHLIVKVEERDTGRFRFGTDVSRSGGVRGRMGVSLRNLDVTRFTGEVRYGKRTLFVGAGQELDLFYEPGEKNQRFVARFADPDLFWSGPTQVGLTLSAQHLNTVLQRSFTERRTDLRAGLWHGFLDGRGRISVGYRAAFFEVGGLDDDAPPDAALVEGWSFVSAARARLRYDDQRIDAHLRLPVAGFRGVASFEVAGGPFGGSFDLWRAEIDVEQRFHLADWPFARPQVLAIRARAAVVRGYGRSDAVPLFERYYAGGRGTLRGFEVRSLGPRQRGDPVGGEVRLLGSVVYSVPLLVLDDTYDPGWRGEILRLVTFLEAANLARTPGELRLDETRVSVGAGLRVRLPYLGQPLGVDLGYAVRSRRGDDREVFSITLGFSF